MSVISNDPQEISKWRTAKNRLQNDRLLETIKTTNKNETFYFDVGSMHKDVLKNFAQLFSTVVLLHNSYKYIYKSFFKFILKKKKLFLIYLLFLYINFLTSQWSKLRVKLS